MIIGELGVKKLRSHDRRAAFRVTRSRIFVVFLFRGFSAKIERSFILALRNKMVVRAMITSRFKVGGCLSGSGNGHLPDTDEVVAVSGEQGLTVSGPGQGEALGRVAPSAARNLRLELIDGVLALEVPDLDGGSGSGAQPVPVGGEAEGIDGILVLQGVQVLAVIEIPQHSLGVLATGGAEGTVGRHGDGVQVAGVTDVVGLQLAVGQVPDLDVFVPSSGDNDGVLVVGGEPHAADPVTVSILLDGVLALGKGVPQLDGLVPGAGDDLSVVGGESHRHDVLGVVLEPPGGLSGGEIPQSEGLVPGS